MGEVLTLYLGDVLGLDAFTAPASETECMFYVYSVLCCLPSAIDDPATAGTGTMRRSTFGGYAKAAGFEGVELLPIEHASLRFYRLDR